MERLGYGSLLSHFYVHTFMVLTAKVCVFAHKMLFIVLKAPFKSPLLLVLMAFCHTLKAQQSLSFLFFEQNTGAYNPAFTVSEGQFVGLGYRAAWSGIEDAPRATSLVYNTKEKNKASWGISFLSDKVYVENQGMVSVDYGYRLQLSDNTNLHLGIKAGANFNNIDLEKLNRITQENNEALGNIQNYLNPLLGIGAYLKSKTYFFGLSVPNFLNTKRFKEINGIQATATDKPHLYTTSGFYLKLNKTITLSPYMLYRMMADAPNQLTAITKLTLKDKLSLGVGVSNNDYISTMIQFKMNQIDLGFGYEIGQRTSATALRANTSEMMLRYRFYINITINLKKENRFYKSHPTLHLKHTKQNRHVYFDYLVEVHCFMRVFLGAFILINYILELQNKS